MTIPVTSALITRRKRTNSFAVEHSENLIMVLDDDNPFEGSETITVQITDVTMACSAPISVVAGPTTLTYTIQDPTGMCVCAYS